MRIGVKAGAALTAVLVLVAAEPAWAHMQFQSAVFYGGMLHAWITPDSALLLVALSAWASLATDAELLPYVTLTLGLTAGVAAGLLGPVPVFQPVAGVVTVAVGLLLATQTRLSRAGGVGVTLVAAVVAGLAAGADAAGDVKESALFMAGEAIGAFVFPLAISGALMDRQTRLVVLGLRIVGSWIAAIGLILFAFRLKQAL